MEERIDPRIDTLASILDKTAIGLGRVTPEMADRPTPCDEFDVDGLTNHMAVWVQVFDAAVNDGHVDFDPHREAVEGDRAVVFAKAADGIVAGLRAHGADRAMSMGGGPMPGEMVLNMMLMEYVGHCWDINRSVGVDIGHDEAETEAALTAAKAIVRPEHRVPGMFGPEQTAPTDAEPIVRLMAFIGRDVGWRPPGQRA